MVDVSEVIEKSYALTERFVKLSLGIDTVYDSRNKWFYSLIPLETVRTAARYTSSEDIRQDFYCFITEEAKRYKKSSKEFLDYLKIALPRFARDKLEGLYRHHCYLQLLATVPDQQVYYPNYDTFIMDLRWVLCAKNLPLNDYERYVLYLHFYKCYTINQISGITYEDRKTVRNTIYTAKETLRSYLYDQGRTADTEHNS